MFIKIKDGKHSSDSVLHALWSIFGPKGFNAGLDVLPTRNKEKSMKTDYRQMPTNALFKGLYSNKWWCREISATLLSERLEDPEILERLVKIINGPNGNAREAAKQAVKDITLDVLSQRHVAANAGA